MQSILISQRYKFIFIKTMKTAGTSIEIALSKYLGADDVITPIFEEDEPLRAAPDYRGPQNYLVPLRRWRRTDWINFLRTRQRPQFHNHMSAARIKQYVAPAVWNTYFKFSVERNPWDKVISWYYWEIPQLPHAKSRFREDRRPYRDVYGQAEREVVRDIFGGEIAALDHTVLSSRPRRFAPSCPYHVTPHRPRPPSLVRDDGHSRGDAGPGTPREQGPREEWLRRFFRCNEDR